MSQVENTPGSGGDGCGCLVLIFLVLGAIYGLVQFIKWAWNS